MRAFLAVLIALFLFTCALSHPITVFAEDAVTYRNMYLDGISRNDIMIAQQAARNLLVELAKTPNDNPNFLYNMGIAKVLLHALDNRYITDAAFKQSERYLYIPKSNTQGISLMPTAVFYNEALTAVSLGIITPLTCIAIINDIEVQHKALMDENAREVRDALKNLSPPPLVIPRTTP